MRYGASRGQGRVLGGLLFSFITVDGAEGGTGAAPIDARGMMLALGCIQALRCHTNRCPTGVTTSDPQLRRGLVVEDQAERVVNYHRAVVSKFLDLLAAAGVTSSSPSSRSRRRCVRRRRCRPCVNGWGVDASLDHTTEE